MRYDYMQQIIDAIEKKPLSRKEFTSIYGLEIPEAYYLFPKYLTLCKDMMVRVQTIGQKVKP